jgi:hypothetical protein
MHVEFLIFPEPWGVGGESIDPERWGTGKNGRRQKGFTV